MENQEIITKTIEFVKETLADAEWGHDRWHIYRVWNMAKHIAQTEKVDILIVELWALLHDIADAKFHHGDDSVGPRVAKEFLESLQVEESIIVHVQQIISNISFGGGNFEQKFFSPELEVVQDADRLDSLWAIGIARTFNYGWSQNREIYNPGIQPNLHMTKEEYRNNKWPSINHFYEKMLLIKEKMNTKTAKQLAEHRHNYVKNFLEEFLQEREGKN